MDAVEIIHSVPLGVTCNRPPLVVKLHGPISRETYDTCVQQFKSLRQRSSLNVIVFSIDCLGGDVVWAFKIGALMDANRHAYGTCIIGIGYQVHSAAGYLYAKCDLRFMHPDAGSVLIHDVSIAFGRDTVQNLTTKLNRIQSDAHKIFRTISRACGKDDSFIENLLHNTYELRWTTVDAHRHGFVHHMGIPKLEHTIKQSFNIDGILFGDYIKRVSHFQTAERPVGEQRTLEQIMS